VVVANQAIVDEVGSCVLATCLEGFPEYFPSLFVASFDKGAFTSQLVLDVLSGVDVVVFLSGDDVMLGVFGVVDEPSWPRVVIVVLFVGAFIVG